MPTSESNEPSTVYVTPSSEAQDSKKQKDASSKKYTLWVILALSVILVLWVVLVILYMMRSETAPSNSYRVVDQQPLPPPPAPALPSSTSTKTSTGTTIPSLPPLTGPIIVSPPPANTPSTSPVITAPVVANEQLIDVFTQFSRQPVVYDEVNAPFVIPNVSENLTVAARTTDVVLSYNRDEETPITEPLPFRKDIIAEHTSGKRMLFTLTATKGSNSQVVKVYIDKLVPRCRFFTSYDSASQTFSSEVQSGSTVRELFVVLDDDDCDGSADLYVRDRQTGSFVIRPWVVPQGSPSSQWYYHFDPSDSTVERFFIRDKASNQTSTFIMNLDRSAPRVELRGSLSNRLYSLSSAFTSILSCPEPLKLRALESGLQYQITSATVPIQSLPISSTWTSFPSSNEYTIQASNQVDTYFRIRIRDAAGNVLRNVSGNDVIDSFQVLIDQSPPSATLQEIQADDTLASGTLSEGAVVFRPSKGIRFTREASTLVLECTRDGVAVSSVSTTYQDLFSTSSSSFDFKETGRFSVVLQDAAGLTRRFSFTVSDSHGFTVRRASDTVSRIPLVSDQVVDEPIAIDLHPDAKESWIRVNSNPVVFVTDPQSGRRTHVVPHVLETSARYTITHTQDSQLTVTVTVDQTKPDVIVETAGSSSSPVVRLTAGSGVFLTHDSIRVQMDPSKTHTVLDQSYLRVNGSSRLPIPLTGSILPITQDGQYTLTIERPSGSSIESYTIHRYSVLGQFELVTASNSSVFVSINGFAQVSSDGFRIRRKSGSIVASDLTISYSFNNGPRQEMKLASTETQTSLFTQAGTYSDLTVSSSSSSYNLGSIQVLAPEPTLVLESVVASNGFVIPRTVSSGGFYRSRNTSETLVYQTLDFPVLTNPRIGLLHGNVVQYFNGTQWLNASIHAPTQTVNMTLTPGFRYMFRALNSTSNTTSDYVVFTYVPNPTLQLISSATQTIFSGQAIRLQSGDYVRLTSSLQTMNDSVRLNTTVESAGSSLPGVTSSNDNAFQQVSSSVFAAEIVSFNSVQEGRYTVELVSKAVSSTVIPLYRSSFLIDITVPNVRYRVVSGEDVSAVFSSSEYTSVDNFSAVSLFTTPSRNTLELTLDPNLEGGDRVTSVSMVIFNAQNQSRTFPLSVTQPIYVRYRNASSLDVFYPSNIMTPQTVSNLIFPLRIFFVDGAGNQRSLLLDYTSAISSYMSLDYSVIGSTSTYIPYDALSGLEVSNNSVLFYQTRLTFPDSSLLSSVSIQRDQQEVLPVGTIPSSYVADVDGSYRVEVKDNLSSTPTTKTYYFGIQRTLDVQYEQEDATTEPLSYTPFTPSTSNSVTNARIRVTNNESSTLEMKIYRNGDLNGTVELTPGSSTILSPPSDPTSNENIRLDFVVPTLVGSASSVLRSDTLRFDTRVDAEFRLAETNTETVFSGSRSSEFLDLIPLEPLQSVTDNGQPLTALSSSQRPSYYAIRGEGSHTIVAKDSVGNQQQWVIVIDTTSAAYGFQYLHPVTSQAVEVSGSLRSSSPYAVYSIESKEELKFVNKEPSSSGGDSVYYTLTTDSSNKRSLAPGAEIDLLDELGVQSAEYDVNALLSVYAQLSDANPYAVYQIRLRNFIDARLVQSDGTTALATIGTSSVYRCTDPACKLVVVDPVLYNTEAEAKVSLSSLSVIDEKGVSVYTPSSSSARTIQINGANRFMAERVYEVNQDGAYTISIMDEFGNSKIVHLIVCSTVDVHFELLGEVTPSSKIGPSFPTLASFADSFVESDTKESWPQQLSDVRRPLRILAPSASELPVYESYTYRRSSSSDLSGQQDTLFVAEQRFDSNGSHYFEVQKTISHQGQSVSRFLCIALQLNTAVDVKLVLRSQNSVQVASNDIVLEDVDLVVSEPLAELLVNGSAVSSYSPSTTSLPATLTTAVPSSSGLHVLQARNEYDQRVYLQFTRLVQLPFSMTWNNQPIPAESQMSTAPVYKTRGAVHPDALAIVSAPVLIAPGIYNDKLELVVERNHPSLSQIEMFVLSSLDFSNSGSYFEAEGEYKVTAQFKSSATDVKGERSTVRYVRLFKIDNSPVLEFSETSGSSDPILLPALQVDSNHRYTLPSKPLFVRSDETIVIEFYSRAQGSNNSEFVAYSPSSTFNANAVTRSALPVFQPGFDYELRVSDVLSNYAVYSFSVSA